MKSSIILPDVLAIVGKRLYEIRRARNEKMTSVEYGTGISHATLSKIEKGSYHCLRMDMLITLLNYYGVTIGDVIDLK